MRANGPILDDATIAIPERLPVARKPVHQFKWMPHAMGRRSLARNPSAPPARQGVQSPD